MEEETQAWERAGKSCLRHLLMFRLQVEHPMYLGHACLHSHKRLNTPGISPLSQLGSHVANMSTCLLQTSSHCQLNSRFAGVSHEVATNKGIMHATLQVLEAKDVYDKGRGQLALTAATTAGADALKQMPHIKFGIEGRFCVTLMPEQRTDHTLLYAIVVDKVDEGQFHKRPTSSALSQPHPLRQAEGPRDGQHRNDLHTS